MIHCQVTSQALSVAALRDSLAIAPSSGGLNIFEGMIRDTNVGRTVAYLEYECYDALAIKEMNRIAGEAVELFQLSDAVAVHRHGRVDIGETAVVIITCSAHRDEAFRGSRYIIDNLKARVPIWKKEFYQDGGHDWTRCQHHHQHEGHV